MTGMGEVIAGCLPVLYEIAKYGLFLGAAYLLAKIVEQFVNGWLIVGMGGLLLIYALSVTFNG